MFRRAAVSRGSLTGAREIHTGRRGCTFHYQKSMPRLPIPALEKTAERWLRAVTPLMQKEELGATERAVEEFKTSGVPLQAKLKERDAADPDNSYINNWWKDMYLQEMRDPLPLNVNPYLQLVDDTRTSDPCVRAASLVESAVHFWRALRDETLEPDIFHMGDIAQQRWFKTLVTFVPARFSYYAAYLAKSFPLDMSQYPWLFSTSRQAMPTRDVLYTDKDARHIAVLANNHVYAVEVVSAQGQAQPQAALERALRWIVSQPATAPLGVGSLTALPRDVWAKTRPRLVADNADSLKALEGALFALCLDPTPVTDAKSGAAVFLHGRANRWYDKSLQLIISGNGRAAINFEHSWGDGVSVLRFANEIVEDSMQRPVVPASAAPAASSAPPPLATRLPFNLKSVHRECAAGDEWLRSKGETLTACELRVQGIGKKFFKSHKVAPDGVVQNAIQLAYRRAFGGGPVATYESASTAGFRKGRTETIRPATIESRAFVDACLSSSSSSATILSLLRTAADVHRQNTTLASTGEGMDRHLFGLRKIAEAEGVKPAIFSDPSYARMNHNILSTSTLVSPFLDGGGFGPVVQDGFGVGYGTTDSVIAFSVTTYRGKSDMSKFLKELEESLIMIKDLFEKQK